MKTLSILLIMIGSVTAFSAMATAHANEVPLNGEYQLDSSKKNGVKCSQTLRIVAASNSFQYCNDRTCGRSVEIKREAPLPEGPSPICYTAAFNAYYVNPSHWHTDLDVRCLDQDSISFTDFILNSNNKDLHQWYKEADERDAVSCFYFRAGK